MMNEKKETKEQKMCKKKELQEMKKLWETMKQKHSDTAKAGSNVTKYRCPSCSKYWETVASSASGYYCPHCGNNRSNWSSYIAR